MWRLKEQQQWQPPLSERREVEIGVVSVLPISYHQLRGPPSRGLRVFMIVQQGLSCLEDGVSL